MLVSLVSGWDSLIVPVGLFSVVALAFFEAVLVLRLWKETRRFEVRRREPAAASEGSGDGS